MTGTQLIDTRCGLPIFTDRPYTLSVWVKLADANGDGRADADGTSISPFYLKFKRGVDAAADRWVFSIPVSDTGGAAQAAATSGIPP